MQESNRRRGSSSLQQPIPVIVGELLKPAATYVVVGNRVYETPSLLKAVDISFKICYALDCRYPVNGHSLWTFIQKAYYSIDIKGNVASCSLNALLGEVQTIIDTS